jgi:hypothetical protein
MQIRHPRWQRHALHACCINNALEVIMARGRRFMASPDEHKLTFLRGSGYLLSLVGVWDLMAAEASQWPSQKGFLIFNETKIVAVIERNEDIRRGVEGTYSVEGNRIIITGLFIDTAPERGALGDGEFAIDGDLLTIKWLSTNQTCQTPHQVDKFRRRVQLGDGVVLPQVAIYESDAPNTTSGR